MKSVPMTWVDAADAAEAISWITYVATVGRDGRPHVAAVAPGLAEPGRVWFAVRRGIQVHRNLEASGDTFFHWPVDTGSGPGELFARARSRLHDSDSARHTYWNQVVPYDQTSFWGSPDNRDLIFVESTVTRVTLVGPEFTRHVWTPD